MEFDVVTAGYSSKNSSAKKYCLFIISFNRLFVLDKCLKSYLNYFSIEDIFIIDKGSDYKPLLDYYEEMILKGINVVYSDKMLFGADGPGGLNDLYIEIDKFKSGYDFYAVTDPDIDLEGCEDDLLEVYSSILESNPNIDIVGPMLRIDDIPDFYPAREWCYTRHVQQFWYKHPNQIFVMNKNIYYQFAKIDSTFGLLRRDTKFQRLLQGKRVYHPYEARHLDWYIDPENMSDDQIYYQLNSNRRVSNWGSKDFDSKIFRELLVGKKRRIICVKENELGVIAPVEFSLPKLKLKLPILINTIVYTKETLNKTLILIKKNLYAIKRIFMNVS